MLNCMYERWRATNGGQCVQLMKTTILHDVYGRRTSMFVLKPKRQIVRLGILDPCNYGDKNDKN